MPGMLNQTVGDDAIFLPRRFKLTLEALKQVLEVMESFGSVLTAERHAVRH